jgi:hypothetical protein
MPEPVCEPSGETQGVGKHERPRSSRARWTAVFAGAATIGLLLAGVIWVFTRVLPDTADPAPASSAATTTATRSSSTSGSALTTAQRSLATCRAHVAAQERLARAAADSARDWRTHTAAQLRLDSGAWTLAQAEAAWNASMARGSADVRQFAEATRALRTGAGSAACRSVETDTASTELAEQGRSCAARDRALSAVGSAGTMVNSQWAEHLVMMADKPHANAADYHDRWVAMVAAAREPLERHALAAQALQRAPACGP